MDVEIHLSRAQLYEQLWSEPTIRVAARLGLSDVGLAKICRSADIPIPPRGYWAKLRNGKNVRRARLPKLEEPIAFVFRPHENSPEPKPPEPEYPDDVVRLIATARALPMIEVRESLDDLHRFVENTRRSLERQPSPAPSYARQDCLVYSEWSKGRPILNVQVGPESIHRALFILDALLKALESIGGKIVVSDGDRPSLRVQLGGQDVGDLVLTERRRQVPNPKLKKDSWFESKTILVAGGELTFSSSTPWVQNHISDTPKGKIDDRLNKVIVRWAENVGKQPIEKALAEARRKEAEERERIRREQEAKRERSRREFEALQTKERRELERLLEKSTRWNQSRQLRDYIAAAREQMTDHAPSENREQALRWLEWAEKQAERIDPLRVSPASFLDMTFAEYEQALSAESSKSPDAGEACITEIHTERPLPR